LEVTATGLSGHGSKDLKDGSSAIEKLGRFLVEAVPNMRETWRTRYYDDLLGTPSINPTVISSGNGAHNVVPGIATMTLDIRTTPSLDVALESLISDLQKEYDVTISSPWSPDLAVCPADSSIYHTAKQALPEIPLRAFPGSTDLPYFLQHDIPMLILGPGETDIMHTSNEWTRVSSMETCKDMIRKIQDMFTSF
jgi:acetylornithine deacetylase/succinyl-diaminopimelate desuccinylase-like protein